MIKQEMSWIGLSVGDFLIEDQIGEGVFSWVYKGVHAAGLFTKAFKVAKPAELVGVADRADGSISQALALLTGYVTEVHPDPADVLSLQAQKLQSVSDPGLPSVEKLVRTEGTCHYEMELIEGLTLRELMEAGPVPIEVFVKIASSMERLRLNPAFQYHGDLKPENILVTHSGIKLIDPGYFGGLECREGKISACAITTPAYYPCLQPDDLLALGLILWETATGDQPLKSPGDCGEIDPARVGKDLLALVRVYESTGKYYYSRILEVRPPTETVPGIDPELSKVLVEALQLRLAPGQVMERGPGYQSFGTLAGALQDLIQHGITHIGSP